MEISSEQLMKIINKTIEKIPRINTNTNYWFVRANGGEFFHSFHIGNYIAIGWNRITLDDLLLLTEDETKRKIKEHYKDIEKPGAAYSQMMKFSNDLKIGDIVIVPSKAPNDLLVGVIDSTPYTETDSNIESVTNVCPFNKRINVKWQGFIRNKDIDPELFKLVYSGHTISDANQYKKFINRGLFDAYIDANSDKPLMSLTFRVKETEDVKAADFNNFISTILDVANIISKDEAEKIVIRTNVQSPGPIEILGDPAVMANIGTILAVVFSSAMIAVGSHLALKFMDVGGKFTISKEGFSVEVGSKAQAEIDRAKANKINAETELLKSQIDVNKISNIQKLVSEEKFRETYKKLDVENSSEIEKALQSAIIEVLTPKKKDSTNDSQI